MSTARARSPQTQPLRAESFQRAPHRNARAAAVEKGNKGLQRGEAEVASCPCEPRGTLQSYRQFKLKWRILPKYSQHQIKKIYTDI